MSTSRCFTCAGVAALRPVQPPPRQPQPAAADAPPPGQPGTRPQEWLPPPPPPPPPPVLAGTASTVAANRGDGGCRHGHGRGSLCGLQGHGGGRGGGGGGGGGPAEQQDVHRVVQVVELVGRCVSESRRDSDAGLKSFELVGWCAWSRREVSARNPTGPFGPFFQSGKQAKRGNLMLVNGGPTVKTPPHPSPSRPHRRLSSRVPSGSWHTAAWQLCFAASKVVHGIS